MKYYIRQIRFDHSTGKSIVLYKRCKCTDGFCADQSKCWQFSRQGAKKIVKDLSEEYKVAVNAGRILFDMIPAQNE